MFNESFFNAPIYIKEENEYDIDVLSSKFRCEDKESTDNILNQIPESIKKTKENGKYKFSYVGVMIIDNRIFYFYPKYMSEFKKNSFKKILNVIEKDKNINGESREEDLFLNESSDILPLILFFIKDYFSYGLYENTRNIIEINGNNEILWEKTINSTFPLIKNNKPYYLELLTKKRINDSNNYFRQLHEIILTECFEILKGAQLDFFFDILSIPKLTTITVNDFDDRNHILRMLDQEMNVQFDTHKLKLLNAMKDYIKQKTSEGLFKGLTLYGTSSFQGVWERVCKDVFDDMLDSHLNQLPLILNKEYKEQENKKLIKLIDYPYWFDESNKDLKPKDKGTLIPDIITIFENNFLIFDAKYYNVEIYYDVEIDEKSIEGQPGIESITKQYLYALAYRKFARFHKLKTYNCFLFPTDGETKIKGYLKFDILQKIGLRNIKSIFISAEELYDVFLSSTLEDDKKWREDLFAKLIKLD